MAVKLRTHAINVLKEITVEPIMVFYTLAHIHHPAVQALVYQKVCLMSFPDNICSNLKDKNLTAEEDIVQAEASHWFMYENFSFEMPAILMALVYGTISDSWSRKASILVPVIGHLLSVISDILNVHYRDSHVGYMLIGRLISGLFGGGIAIHLAVSSYLSAFTTEKTRTTRMAIMGGICSLTAAIAGYTSGIILDNTSFIFVFLLTLAIYFIIILYTIIFVKELQQDKQNRQENQNVMKKGCSGFLSTGMASIKCLLKKRRFNRRVHIFVIMACIFTFSIGHHGNYFKPTTQDCRIRH